MRMLIGMLIRGCIEAPHPVVAREAVCEVFRNQPVEHAIDGYAINVKRPPHVSLDFVMGQCPRCVEQGGEHAHSWLRYSRTYAANHVFCRNALIANHAPPLQGWELKHGPAVNATLLQQERSKARGPLGGNA